ncbi:hypothetical protein GCM10009678_56020 [Actinomadura kijaniata]|uniref:Uncharacterized protein n=1 Tax=Actinomadura namibiensis TaxID=182080 RepID=A0A7W3LRN5_ACTNM|nr:hypothetical protein [Actinomadura namibiensis]MBA8952972.1 hypothetical protein [Actinomadura namibiensis]
MFHEVGRLWASRLDEPFPEVPGEVEGELVRLDTTVAGCVSTYLHGGGAIDSGRQNAIRSCHAELAGQVARLGYPSPHCTAFGYFLQRHKTSELIINDTPAQPLPPEELGSSRMHADRQVSAALAVR